VADAAQVTVPFTPDSNLVCLAINPRSNRDVRVANAFMAALQNLLKCDPSHPLQAKEFFGSGTILRPNMLGAEEMARIFDALGLERVANDYGSEDGHLHILRHTLMNPYLVNRETGVNYIDLYFDFLERSVRSLHAQSFITSDVA